MLSVRGLQGGPAWLLLSPVVISLLKCGMGEEVRAQEADRLGSAVPLLCDLGQTLPSLDPMGT